MYKNHQIFKIGNASTNNSQGGQVFLTKGVFPTICSGPHSWASGNILVKVKSNENDTRQLI